MKKSQITFFIAFILILFLIVGFFLYQVANLSYEPITERVPIDARAVEHMVSSCFDIATDRALLLTARGGGRIYDPDFDIYYDVSPEEYGNVTVPYVLGGNITFTTYGVRRGNLTHELPGPPDYPYPGFLVPNHPNNFNFMYLRFFEDPQSFQPYRTYLTPLCDEEGMNHPRFGYHRHSCLTYNSTYMNYSIQNIMENYAKEFLINCTTDMVEREYGYAEIELSEAKVESFIGEIDVVFNLNYPVNYGDQIETYRFTSRKNARLMYAYDLAACMIREDARNVFFDMTNENELSNILIKKGAFPNIFDVPCLKEGFSIKRIKNACVHAYTEDPSFFCTEEKWNHTDVIIINDTFSSVGGEQLIFSFAVENRRPALDLIKRTSGEISNYYDIVTFSGANLRIIPEAYDPDQDFHNDDCSKGPCMNRTYVYSGWKADYDEIFNFLTLPNGDTSFENVTGIKNLTDGTDIDFPNSINITKPVDGLGNKLLPTYNTFSGKVSCRMGDSLHDGSVCLSNLNLWHNSTKFQETKRIAEFRTSLQDAGSHVVRVTVYDRERLFDFQDIRILVKPLLGGGFSPYVSQDDIKPEYASWEDSYTINVQSSLYEVYGNVLFNWTDDCSTGNKLIGSGEVNSTHPYAEINIVKDIDDPKGVFNFSNPITDPNCNSQSRLKLNLYNQNNNLIETFSYKLDVFECLPYLGIPNSEVYPFEYNLGNPNEDELFRIHSCCNNEVNNWGTYKDDSNICYEYEKNYPLYYLKDEYELENNEFQDSIYPADLVMNESISNGYPHELIPYTNDIHLKLPSGFNYDESSKNDIVFRTFTQNCSGNRGNACTGPFSDKGEIIECNYKNETVGEIASCQWPCNPISSNCNKDDIGDHLNIVSGSCFNNTLHYDGSHPHLISMRSFEKNFLKINDGKIGEGFCNPIKKCSPSYNLYGNGGDYLNKGVCGNDGTCSGGYMVKNCSEEGTGYLTDDTRTTNIHYYQETGCVSSGDPLTNDSCGNVGSEVNLDNNQYRCENHDELDCNGGSCWVYHYEQGVPPGEYTGGPEEIENCCGDDANENFSEKFVNGNLIRGCCREGRVINATGYCDDPII